MEGIVAQKPMKIVITIGANNFSFEGETGAFDAPSVRAALTAWFEAQTVDIITLTQTLKNVAAQINADTTLVEKSKATLETAD